MSRTSRRRASILLSRRCLTHTKGIICARCKGTPRTSSGLSTLRTTQFLCAACSRSIPHVRCRVEDWRGAPKVWPIRSPRFLWECLTSQTVGPFPAPATSNAACGFPALRFPDGFTSRVMEPIERAALSHQGHDEAGNHQRVPACHISRGYSICSSRNLDAFWPASWRV